MPLLSATTAQIVDSVAEVQMAQKSIISRYEKLRACSEIVCSIYCTVHVGAMGWCESRREQAGARDKYLQQFQYNRYNRDTQQQLEHQLH